MLCVAKGNHGIVNLINGVSNDQVKIFAFLSKEKNSSMELAVI